MSGAAHLIVDSHPYIHKTNLISNSQQFSKTHVTLVYFSYLNLCCCEGIKVVIHKLLRQPYNSI